MTTKTATRKLDELSALIAEAQREAEIAGTYDEPTIEDCILPGGDSRYL